MTEVSRPFARYQTPQNQIITIQGTALLAMARSTSGRDELQITDRWEFLQMRTRAKLESAPSARSTPELRLIGHPRRAGIDLKVFHGDFGSEAPVKAPEDRVGFPCTTQIGVNPAVVMAPSMVSQIMSSIAGVPRPDRDLWRRVISVEGIQRSTPPLRKLPSCVSAIFALGCTRSATETTYPSTVEVALWVVNFATLPASLRVLTCC